MTEQATTPRRAKPYSTDLTDKEWESPVLKGNES